MSDEPRGVITPPRPPPKSDGLGSKLLLTAAGVVVVVAGLRAAQLLLVPFTVSLFLAILGSPLLAMLRRRGVPSGIAVAAVVLVNLTVIAAFITLVGTSLAEFTEALPRYRERFEVLLGSAAAGMRARGWEVTSATLMEYFDPGALLTMLAGALQGVAQVLSNVVLILLTLVFILLEATGFESKLRRAPGDPAKLLQRASEVALEVQRYLGLKTAISMATGVLLGSWVGLLGVDFPLLWGLLAFLLNYIPNLGSIMAAVPPVLLSLVQFGAGRAALVAGGYLLVNMALGNLLEPMMMGRRLGLSPLVVFASLIFWGWAWGPVGMLLSVPLMMVVKISLETSREHGWVAMLLDSAPPARATVPDEKLPGGR